MPLYKFTTYRTDEAPKIAAHLLITDFVVYRAHTDPTVEDFKGASGVIGFIRKDDPEYTTVDQWIWYGPGKGIAFDMFHYSNTYFALRDFIFSELERLGIYSEMKEQ